MTNPPTVLMQAPPTWGGVLNGTPSGTVYVPNADGQVAALYADIGVLTKLGFTPVNSESNFIGALLGANMNVTTDQQIPLFLPPTKLFTVSQILVTNASISLTTAVGGFYPAASKGGTALVSNSQAYSGLTGSGLAISLTLAGLARFAAGTNLYLSLTTAQGAAATADVYVYGDELFQ